MPPENLREFCANFARQLRNKNATGSTRFNAFQHPSTTTDLALAKGIEMTGPDDGNGRLKW